MLSLKGDTQVPPVENSEHEKIDLFPVSAFSLVGQSILPYSQHWRDKKLITDVQLTRWAIEGTQRHPSGDGGDVPRSPPKSDPKF